MANDAKLGLVLGVAIVLVIGLVFFRSDPAGARPSSDPQRPAISNEAPSTSGQSARLTTAR